MGQKSHSHLGEKWKRKERLSREKWIHPCSQFFRERKQAVRYFKQNDWNESIHASIEQGSKINAKI